MPEQHDWRSDADYDFIDRLTTSELAWEFLRRNLDYRKAYESLAARGQLDSDQARAVAEQWGLCFRRRSPAHSNRSSYLLDPECRPWGNSTPQDVPRFRRFRRC